MMNFFQITPTELHLNGPNVGFSSVPLDAQATLTGVATFTAIGTASFPYNAVDGSFSFDWYFDGTKVEDSNIDTDGSLGISTFTISGLTQDDNNKKVYVIANYIPGPDENVIDYPAESKGSADSRDFSGSAGAVLVTPPQIVITKQPQTSVVGSGNTTTFKVEAQINDGTKSGLSYQWYVDGKPQSNTTTTINRAAICISVIDESSPSAQTIADGWNDFRANHPTRPFFLLQPSGLAPSRLKIPDSYTNDPLAYAPQTVNRDNGNSNDTSDWFSLCSLAQAAPGTSISLAIDNSGSVTTDQVQASLDLFNEKCAAAGLNVYQVNIQPSEQWAPPHNKDLPEIITSGLTFSGAKTDTLTVSASPGAPVGSPAICISVIDESSPGAQFTADDWTTFRSKYPSRPFWLLQPTGYDPSRLKLPDAYINDSSANYPQTVNRDNGNSNDTSDWFNMCDLSLAPRGTTISLAIDNSGSMTTGQVKASLDLFNEKCAAAGLTIVQVDIQPSERWVVPHDKPLPETSDFAPRNIYCEVSDSRAVNTPLNSSTVSLVVVAARSLLNFSGYSIDNDYTTQQVNLDSDKTFTLTSDTFGSKYGIIQFHTVEKDVPVRLNINAAAGANRGTINGGEGGTSIIEFTAKKNREYTVIGVSNNSAVFLYEKSTLKSVVGQGGDAGSSSRGGAGGGINISGEDAPNGGGAGASVVPLNLNGVFGSIVNLYSVKPLLYSGDTIETGANGGRTISCSKGRYRIDQGISACSDNSNVPIKFINIDGTTIADSPTISRGFKPGYTVTDTKGAALVFGVGGNGGNGARGGDGSSAVADSGGGGGSGYSNGTVDIINATLGGNSSTNSSITFGFQSGADTSPPAQTQDVTFTITQNNRLRTIDTITYQLVSGSGPEKLIFKSLENTTPNPGAPLNNAVPSATHTFVANIARGTVYGLESATAIIRTTGNTVEMEASNDQDWDDLTVTPDKGKFTNASTYIADF